MPDRTFNLGHGAARESDRSLPARGSLRNRGKERRPGGAAAEKKRAQQARKTWLLERWIRSEVLSSRSRTRFFDAETDSLHVLCLSVAEQFSGTRVPPCGISSVQYGVRDCEVRIRSCVITFAYRFPISMYYTVIIT